MLKKTTFCCLISIFTLFILSGCMRKYIRIQSTDVSLQDKFLLIEKRLPIREEGGYAYVPFTLGIRRSTQNKIQNIFSNTDFGSGDAKQAFGLYKVTREQNRVVEQFLMSDVYIFDANSDSLLKTFFETAEYKSAYNLNTSQIKEKMDQKYTSDKHVMQVWKNEPDYVERSLVFVFKKGSLKSDKNTGLCLDQRTVKRFRISSGCSIVTI